MNLEQRHAQRRAYGGSSANATAENCPRGSTPPGSSRKSKQSNGRPQRCDPSGRNNVHETQPAKMDAAQGRRDVVSQATEPQSMSDLKLILPPPLPTTAEPLADQLEDTSRLALKRAHEFCRGRSTVSISNSATG